MATPSGAAGASTPVKTTPTKASPAAKKAKAEPAVDTECPLKSAAVFEVYSVMLNQTNVGANNNKFYRMQLLGASLLM